MTNFIEEFSFKDANHFSMFIEEKALEQKLSVIDTVIKFCDEHKLDPQEIVPFINRNLKEKLEAEFIDARMLPAYSQLEF